MKAAGNQTASKRTLIKNAHVLPIKEAHTPTQIHTHLVFSLQDKQHALIQPITSPSTVPSQTLMNFLPWELLWSGYDHKGVIKQRYYRTPIKLRLLLHHALILHAHHRGSKNKAKKKKKKNKMPTPNHVASVHQCMQEKTRGIVEISALNRVLGLLFFLFSFRIILPWKSQSKGL